MTITKSHLKDSIQKRLNLPKKKSARLADSLLEIIKDTLERGEEVQINGFGKFSVQDNNGKRGKRFNNCVEIPPEAGRVVTFRCSPVLRDMINGKLSGKWTNTASTSTPPDLENTKNRN